MHPHGSGNLSTLVRLVVRKLRFLICLTPNYVPQHAEDSAHRDKSQTIEPSNQATVVNGEASMKYMSRFPKQDFAL